MRNERGSFGSRLGIVLATAGYFIIQKLIVNQIYYFISVSILLW